ncbi:MAG: CpaD family pilus assembly lipoprotein [Alphaproteobacteria bacterium]
MKNSKVFMLIFIIFLSASCKNIYDYRTEHPITVEPNEVTLKIDINENGEISEQSVAKIETNIKDYLTKGDGNIEVFTTFVSGESDSAAYLKAAKLAEVLEEQGITSEKIILNLLPVESQSLEKTKYSYIKFIIYNAKLPDCGRWESYNPNLQHPNFGCATQHNIGLMVSNPKDLIEQRPSSPRSAVRGETIIRKYEAGEETNSESEVEASLIN